MRTGVHGQTASAAAEAVALRAVLAGVAVLAEQLLLVLGAVGRVQRLVAQACGFFGGWEARAMFMLSMRCSHSLPSSIFVHNGVEVVYTYRT